MDAIKEKGQWAAVVHGRYDMSKLVSDGNTEDAESNQALRVEFQEQVVERARAGAAWFVEGGLDEK